VYSACCELSVPFCTQIGHTGPLMPSEVGRPIYLDQVALDFPELTIVAGHIGYPWTDEAVAVATKHVNVHIDTSAYTVKRYPRALVEFMRGHGRTKVLFGTNYPMIIPAKALEGLDGLALDEDSKALFRVTCELASRHSAKQCAIPRNFRVCDTSNRRIQFATMPNTRCAFRPRVRPTTWMVVSRSTSV